ncbi:MAG: dockerin type I repeat-containing protein [Clostridia bacterium]|nr:dockerin type I repeat-containing protein [Clostridia bacterium]
MKKITAILLFVFMLANLCTVSAFALGSADNSKMKVLAPADKSSAFYENDLEAYGFDVKGYVELDGYEQLISSTFSNYGYHTFLNVDGAYGKMDGILYYGAKSAYEYAEEQTADLYDQYNNDEIDYSVYREAYDQAYEEWEALVEAEGEFDLESNLSAMSYNCAGALEQTIGGLKLKLENSFAGGGNYVKIQYTVTNPTSSSKKFSLATTSDVQVNGDDSATLKLLPNGLGAKLVSDDGSMFVVDGANGGVDNVWIGNWDYDYFANMFNDSEDGAIYDDGDSAICWSWINRTLAAGKSVTFYVLMEVGINEGPEVVIDDDLNDVGASLDGYILDPNLGTVDLHYTIDGGEEQVIENISVTDERTPFAIPLDEFECGSSHTIKVWAVDDAGESSDVETVVINITHPWGIPEVTAAPTATQPGTVVYTCTVCGEKKTEYIYLGDANGDGVLNSLDAALILKYDAMIITDLTPLQLMLCDANGDGTVNSLDAAQILKYDAMIITSFANANFSLEAYIQLCIDYYGHYVDVVE